MSSNNISQFLMQVQTPALRLDVLPYRHISERSYCDHLFNEYNLSFQKGSKKPPPPPKKSYSQNLYHRVHIIFGALLLSAMKSIVHFPPDCSN